MDDDVLFSIDRRRFHSSREQVERELKRFAAAFDVSDRTRGNYQAWKSKTISADVIVRMFGSFTNACAAFGIESGGKVDYYSDDELLATFEAVWRWRGHKPALGDFRKFKEATGKGVHFDVIRRRFGPYKDFQRLFSEYKRGVISKETLLLEAKPVRSRAPIGQRLRFEVLTRDGFRCVLCGSAAPEVKLEVDHIVAASKKGSAELTNLRTLCHACNSGRGDRD
ncbi:MULTISPECIES: HNH endonuclease [unclassified Caballeronia]|uniref:HNH endonuclease n=1 Tax=unclassified Caballeronia TaxID=2646786 RepID=UPI0020288F6B|nr:MULTISPECIES: HNH endonuclease [unclassified Caballeronia]MDR5787867.1 HNH endonuclease [Caballeronia sp. LP003]